MNTTKLKAVLTIPALAGTLAGVLAAQNPAKQSMLMAMQANGKQMRVYQWKQKITVVRKGDASQPVIEEVRIDADGQPRRVTLVQPEDHDHGKKKMGPMGALIAKKTAEIKESVQETMQLAGRYVNPQQVAQVVQKGELWEGQGTLRIHAGSLIVPGDDMTVTASTASYLPTRAEVKTQHDGGPVQITAEYEQLPNGPSLMTRMTVRIPDRSIVVNVEAFDFNGPAVSAAR